MADDILDKADSLMRRHRAFVAGDSPAPGTARAAALSEAEDLPVLTEVVGDTESSTAPTPSAVTDIDALLRDRISALQPHQRELLRRELATWLDEQLPQLVMRVLDGVTDQLVAQINTQARVSLLPKLQAVLEYSEAEPPSGS
jgi:hypothetical protein